jgi:site-specific recombinase XerD
MIDAMLVRGFSPRTHKSYLAAVTDLARHYHRSPDQISLEEIQAYILYLVKERHLADASCRLYLNGLRFLYLQVLGRSDFDVPIPHPKRVHRIPELLTRREVARLIGCCTTLKHRTMLLTCYGCGLRVSELVHIKVRDLDGERRLLRVEQGKGAKDRKVIIAPTLLQRLRAYWRQRHPRSVWLFPNANQPDRSLSITTAQKTYQAAKQAAGIEKVGGIHSLRHAYATHQLEAGLPVHLLQYQLGHSNIQSTLRYVHWAPNARQGKATVEDLVQGLAVDHD